MVVVVVVMVVVVVVLRVDVRLLRSIKSSGIVVVVVLDVVLGRLRVQLVKMVLDTSRGMMKMMRKEKYQAVRTASVTNTGCLIQLEYLRRKSEKASYDLSILQLMCCVKINGIM